MSKIIFDKEKVMLENKSYRNVNDFINSLLTERNQIRDRRLNIKSELKAINKREKVINKVLGDVALKNNIADPKPQQVKES